MTTIVAVLATVGMLWRVVYEYRKTAAISWGFAFAALCFLAVALLPIV
jgi:hypothetical protein